jgi:hypothetical protein
MESVNTGFICTSWNNGPNNWSGGKMAGTTLYIGGVSINFIFCLLTCFPAKIGFRSERQVLLRADKMLITYLQAVWPYLTSSFQLSLLFRRVESAAPLQSVVQFA